MMSKRILFLSLIILSFSVVCGTFAGYSIWSKFRPQPAAQNETIFQGVHYLRDVRNTPRSLVLHIITIDLRAPGISILVTPGAPGAAGPLPARTTGKFLDDYNLQLAINGDSFAPWFDNGFFSYHPHSGDRVDPVGYAASRGEPYSTATDAEPVLYFTQTSRAMFNSPPARIYNAISGNQMLVAKGKVLPQSDDSPQPRSAIGLDKNARRMILVVVDGRLPGYSEGVTLTELAQILVEAGAHEAMNLDGGGSSTLVREGALGRPVLLNTPIHNQIPNRQRPVGNHIGIFANPADGG
jgi:hypothetical protein